MGQVWRLLQHVWGTQEGYVFLPEKENGRWVEGEALVYSGGLLDPVSVSAQRDVYFSPLVFSKTHRRAEHALPTHVLWSDLDAVDPATCALRPSAAWKTTQGGYCDKHASEHENDEQPHWQALWFLGTTQPTFSLGMDFGPPVPIPAQHTLIDIPAVEAAELSRRIAYAEGADKGGWDITQVLRLPGTLNHKHSPAQRIELLWAEHRYYTPEKIREVYPAPELTTGVWEVDAMFNHEINDAMVTQAIKALPVGVQMALERDAWGADRSLQLVKLATELLRFGAPAAVVPWILKRTALNKFAGRRDEMQRLVTATADALVSLH